MTVEEAIDLLNTLSMPAADDTRRLSTEEVRAQSSKHSSARACGKFLGDAATIEKALASS